ncbi:MAG: dihydrolipoyl dehydrogenase [Chlamydiae bacterium]|nr:dihydrolipoyl dehydrogenase [Chlamydiota bacterium]
MEKFDVIVIGSGPGGYVAAIRAAQLGLKTACVEKDPVLGGTCLNVGCIPSKALLHSTEQFASLSKAKELGIIVENFRVDFLQMMERKKQIVKDFNEGIAFLFKKNHISSFQGHASLISPNKIEVKGKEKIELESKSIILATGSQSIELPFLPFDEKQIVSSTGALSLEKVPKKMVVIGAGIIGVELGSVYKRLGAEVVFIEFLERICSVMDESITAELKKLLEKQGMSFHLSSKVVSAKKESNKIKLQVEKGDNHVELEADVVLVSIGRKPYTKDLGLEQVGIKTNEKGFIPINGRFQTVVPSIYAIGDIIDGPMLAHKAQEEGIAVAELISGYYPQIDYTTVPNVIYTSPEVATVGLTEAEAKQMGLSLKVGSFPFSINSRAKCTGELEGFVKVIGDANSDRILGVHIISAHASELISEAVIAMQNRIKLLELASAFHAHPTLSEAIKEACLAAHKRAIHKG